MLDSLTTYYLLPTSDSVARWVEQSVGTEQIYGVTSSFSGQIIAHTNAWGQSLGASLSWQGGVMLLVLLLMFCYATYRFEGLVRLGFKSFFSIDESILLFDNSRLEFSYYIYYSRLLFLGSVAIAVEGLFLDGLGGDILNVLLLMGAFVTASTISVWLIGLLSVFDYNKQRWKDLRSLRKFDRTISAYLLALPVISFSYASLMHITLGVVFGVVLTAHFIRLVIFFHLRGFSFLQSFLYLCAVEIAPFALLWGVFVRLNSIHF